MEHFFNSDNVTLITLCVCGFLVGVSKTGVPGIGILNVPLMALVFPAKASTGLLLPILCGADILAVGYYRRHAEWKHVFRLLPWALIGIATGSALIPHINDQALKPIIGVIVLIMLGVNYWRLRRPGAEMKIPKHWAFSAAMGFTAGLTTQLANAAGPIMVIYLLAMQLPKNAFIGTSAWYFLILNFTKVPLFILDGRITVSSFQTDLIAIPFIIIGAITGILVLKKMPQNLFNKVVQILAVAAAVKLTLSAFGW